MKKIILFSLVLLSVASVSIYSCKKGPEDPAISFKSRKARVTGSWKVTEYTVNGNDSLVRATSYPGNDTCQSTYTVSTTTDEVFDFDKNGSYSNTNTLKPAVTVVNLNSHCKNSSYAGKDSVYVVKGLWQFAGGVGAYKNKEQIVLTDGEDHVFGTTYDLVECSSKELKLQVAITDQSTGLVTIYKWTLQPNK